MNTKLNLVNQHLQYREVSLTSPSNSCYLHIAAEIDHFYLPFQFKKSKKKSFVISEAKKWCHALAKEKDVISAVVFTAAVIPPGKGSLLKERKHVHEAKFDVCILVEVADAQVLARIRCDESFIKMEQLISKHSSFVHTMEAQNEKQINPVDHSRQGIFLFNYFYGDDLQQTVEIWKYTAGYFQQETGLNNSTVLVPIVQDNSIYTIINHCRWDSMLDILPTLIFKKSFRNYVLAHFYANHVAPMPILYRLA